MEVNELEVGQSKKVLNSDSFPELKQVQLLYVELAVLGKCAAVSRD